MNILLLEDDMILNDIITEFLSELGFEVDSFYDGDMALESIEKRGYDIILLDVGVPGIDGFEILEYLRAIMITTPVIFITSLNSAKDFEKAFGLGCDDYIKKPFELKELELRIKKIVKKSDSKRLIEIDNSVSYDFDKKTLFSEGKSYTLPKKEWMIFEYLLQNRDRVISIDEMIANLWSYEDTPTYATIRTYIKNLRKILPKNSITTLKGIGYKLEI